MQDNNQANATPNQVSFPQGTDVPPMPPIIPVPDSLKQPSVPFENSTASSQPLEPVEPSFINPNPVIAPDLPKTENIPTPVIVEPIKKKSPLITISLVLLLISAIAIGIYFFVKTFGVAKIDNSTVIIPTEEPAVMETQETQLPTPEETVMPASDSPDVIPTIPENSP